MTDPEGTPQEAELDPEPSTDETAADVKQEAGEEGVAADSPEAKEKGLTADYQIAGEKAATVDYQTRLEQFDNVESAPVVSLPVKTPSPEKSDEV